LEGDKPEPEPARFDLVMIHGRHNGWGPKPTVAVDIFRVVRGKVTEYWNVMQEELPAGVTNSDNSMFANRQMGLPNWIDPRECDPA
jgi:hypothetical protein